MGVFFKYVILQLVLLEHLHLYPELWVQNLGGIAQILRYVDSRLHRIIHRFNEARAHHVVATQHEPPILTVNLNAKASGPFASELQKPPSPAPPRLREC